MTQDIRKYEFIDALRGYAIIGVMLVHASEFLPPTHPILQFLMPLGARGVQLFYIASALTLCLSWEFRKTHEKFPIRNFFIRRFFRIAPMFYLAIIFYQLLYGYAPRHWAPNGIEWWYAPLTALFLNGFHPETINAIVPGEWSIAVEMNFYLILPWVLLHLKTTRSFVFFLVASLALYAVSKQLILFLFQEHYPPEQEHLVADFHYLNFFGQLPVFAIGLLSYIAFRKPNHLKKTIWIGSFLLIAFLLLCFLLPPAMYGKIFRNHLVFGLGFALFALWLSLYPVPAIVNKPIVQLGKLSFSMYLSHVGVLELFSKLGLNAVFQQGIVANLLHFLCVLSVTVCLSYLFQISIESWGILTGKRLIEKLESQPPSKND